MPRVTCFGLALFVVLLFGMSCVSRLGHLFSGRDSRSLVVQTLNLYNQVPVKVNTDLLRGFANDWVFRRERLAAIDASLRNNRPDIFLAQQAVAEDQSPADADDLILQAGSLSGYEADKQVLPDPLASGDLQFFYTAVSLPIKVRTSRYTPTTTVTEVVNGVFVAISVLEFEELPILVMQIDKQTPTGDLALATFYGNLAAIAKEYVERYSLCANRVIVAGYLPSGEDGATLESILDPLDWIDTSAEYCDRKLSNCTTLTHDNILVSTFDPDSKVGQFDRIIAHKDAAVISSSVAFNQSFKGSNYVSMYSLSELSLSLRYGWATELRLPRCSP